MKKINKNIKTESIQKSYKKVLLNMNFSNKNYIIFIKKRLNFLYKNQKIFNYNLKNNLLSYDKILFNKNYILNITNLCVLDSIIKEWAPNILYILILKKKYIFKTFFKYIFFDIHNIIFKFFKILKFINFKILKNLNIINLKIFLNFYKKI